MHTAHLLRLAAATAAGVVAVSTMAVAPALAAPPTRTPVPTVTTKPADPTADRYATFQWTAVAGTTYTCALDGAAASACAGESSYGPLADGLHSFVLRARAPKPSRPSTWSYSWRVAATPPSAPSVAQVPSPTRTTSAMISFVNTDPTAVANTCAVDGGTQVSCTSPYPVAGPLAEGPHTVDVRAQNAYGTISAPNSSSWVVDLTAPSNVAVVGPTSPTRSTSATVSFSEPDAVAFTCAVDGGAAAACTSPLDLPGPLADGEHSVTVTAVDAAGNRSNPVQAVWVVDTTAPSNPFVVTGPAPLTNQTSASFVIGNVDDGASLQCRLDSSSASDWQDCTSPKDYFALAAAAHRFEVRAHDVAGNVSDIDTTDWTIDTSVPSPAVFIGGPTGPNNEARPTFTFASTDPTIDVFECALDDAAYVPCDTSGDWPTGLGDVVTEGEHFFAVRTVNGAGTPSAAVTWTWVHDTVAPAQPVFSSSPQATTTDTTALFAFASESGATFTCSVDGGAAQPCASPVSLHDLLLGGHTFAVTAQDAAHNVSASAQYSWTVVAPSTPDPGTTDPVTPPVTPPGTGTPTAPTAPSAPAAPTSPTAPAAPAAPVTATISTSSALKGTSTVDFPQDVHGVSTSSVLMKASGGASNLAVSLSCKNAAGAPVDCANGAVRKVLVQPKAALVPGQSYTLSVTGGVVETSLRSVSAVAKSFRASTVEQESSLRASSTWRAAKAAAAYGRRYITERRAGAAVSMTFRGPRVDWYTMTAPTQGVATVYVDGVKKARVNNYSASTKWHVARTVRGLSKGTHRLRIVVAGVKGSKAGTGTGVVLDAVKAAAKLTTNPSVTATWRVARATGASGGGYAVTDQAGATSSFAFRGTGVTWFTATAPTMGKAKVYVDGVLKATVDNYSKRAVWNVRRAVTGLSDSTHTVKIVVLGAKRSTSKGKDVVVDRWVVS